jgi:hypothetical protein
VVNSGSCATDTSSSVLVNVTNTNTWTGTSSSSWADAGNWSCGLVPTAATDVVVNGGTPNSPVLSTAGSAGSVTVNSGATLTLINTLSAHNVVVLTGGTLELNNTASHLTISGDFDLQGTFTQTAGSVEFNGTAIQQMPAASYYNIIINNSQDVVLDGGSSTANNLTFVNGSLVLGNLDLTLAGTISGSSSLRFVITDGIGKLNIQNIGTGGHTGTVLFPVGKTIGSYTPVSIENTGTADMFSVRVVDSLRTDGLTGTAILNNGVNKTWVIEEGTPGGSNVTLTTQWNATDELSGFNRSLSYLAQYNGSQWMPNAETAASGTNPYTQTRSGISVITPVGVGSSGTLPVDLLSFTGSVKGKGVQLNWITASEINNSHFVIERSADNKTFSAIGTVKGAGTTSMVTRYVSADNEAAAFAKTNAISTIYYRLRQVDFDGQQEIHKSIAVQLTAGKDVIAAYPNPFNSTFNLQIASQSAQESSIEVMDFAGRRIALVSKHLEEGTNSFTMDELSDVRTGVYFIHVTTGNGVQTVKMIKH